MNYPDRVYNEVHISITGINFETARAGIREKSQRKVKDLSWILPQVLCCIFLHISFVLSFVLSFPWCPLFFFVRSSKYTLHRKEWNYENSFFNLRSAGLISHRRCSSADWVSVRSHAYGHIHSRLYNTSTFSIDVCVSLWTFRMQIDRPFCSTKEAKSFHREKPWRPPNGVPRITRVSSLQYLKEIYVLEYQLIEIMIFIAVIPIFIFIKSFYPVYQ